MQIASKTNSVDAIVEVTTDVIVGSVSYPHGWGHDGGWTGANETTGANINLLASSDPADWEQISAMCFLDGIPVTVTPIALIAAADNGPLIPE